MASHGPRHLVDRRIVAGLVVVLLCGGTLLIGVVRGHAGGMSVVAGRMTTLRPAELPPKCSTVTVTVTADADTYISQGATGSNYGGLGTLSVYARNNQNHRALIHFALPAAPTGCTLTSATLRVNNASATAGRTIAAYAAGEAWSETTVTWASHTALPTGTPVDVAAATGTMSWTVTALVQSMYAGTNHGFLLRDTAETGGGNTNNVQQFTSREGATKPQLELQWQ